MPPATAHRPPGLRRHPCTSALLAAAILSCGPPTTAASSPPASAATASSPPASAATASSAWRRPVPGAVTRAFAYSPSEPFAGGRHRGVDLAAHPGDAVRAACSGRVAFAGRGVVTLRCGPWRVTHLPVTARVHAGERVRAGARIGTLATGGDHAGERVRAGARIGTLATGGDHAGLHLGVRREGDRFGYVDPLPFLAAPPPPAAGPVPREGPRSVPRTAPPANAPATPKGAPLSPPAGERVRVPADRRIAPWPVWVGLGLVLCGAIGGGIRVRAGNRRRVAEAVAS
jgi:Peptidase family M23